MNRRQFIYSSAAPLAFVASAQKANPVASGDQPIAYTKEEGGNWIPRPTWQKYFKGKQPAAAMYSDGSIYDFVLAEFFPEVSPWRKA